MSTETLTKAEFRVDDGEGGLDVETPWVLPLGGNLFRLENSPFFAYRVSWEDVIEAIPETADGFPVFTRVVEKSGNRTVRVMFEKPAEEGNESQATLDELVAFGCSFEGANPRYIAINIPKEIDLGEACEILVRRNVRWEHADPSYDEIYPSDE